MQETNTRLLDGTDRAYDMVRPTMPADRPLPVDTLMIANPAAERMMTDPINSRRTPNHRLALMDGMYARKLASTRHSFSRVNRSCWQYARMVVMPPSDSWK